MIESTINKKITLFSTIFFLSGFSALIYQITWQRLLFSVFGIDIESVTIIVTVFMLGLGVGGKLGGNLADKLRNHCIQLFLACELMIGLFGFFSQEFIMLVSSSSSDFLVIKIIALLLIPTTLMGATLPLLSIALIDKGGVVGNVVSSLYSFNTLGAAFACLFLGFFIFNFWGLSYVIYLAAGINLLISLIGLVLWKIK